MKLYKIVILSFFLLFIEANAQQPASVSKISNVKDTGPLIDTTDFFPMQNGNYWEYAATTIDGPVYFGTTVIGDTIMPNGKAYKILAEKYINISGSRYTWYFRKDSNKVYYSFPYPNICSNEEYKYLDFDIKDSSLWPICRDLGMAVGNARGIARTFYDYIYYRFLQKPLETKQFEDVYIDSTDTTWTPGEGSRPIRIAKGIGIVRQFIFNDGDYWLQGAIINGVKFGTITDVKEEKLIIPTNLKVEAYPNPFNSTVTLKLSLPRSGFTEVSLYNILGQKIKTILEEYKPSGSYSIKYNADNLSSGVYLLMLRQNQFISQQKIILLK